MLDPLSIEEIRAAAKIIRDYASPKSLKFNCLTLREPKKAEYAAFRARTGPRPARRAFAIVIEKGTSKVSEVVANIAESKVEEWNAVSEVGPTLTLEDLDVCERVARADPRVIKACKDIGIDDMSKVFLDAWAIGVDNRWGFERRLQQGLAYYRASPNDNQYAHPLDFSVVVDTEKEEVLTVDVRYVNGERTKVPLTSHNYMPEFIGDNYIDGTLKPINITQPQGVSFRMRGNEISWAGYKMHIGFNYREGIVLSDVRMEDQHEQRERTLFNRISVVEMVVPYGNPEPPHHKKHAFDVGEYGTGLMTNSLKLGCDCKGAIHYLDAVMATGEGDPAVIKNAICIHEEDNGILFKHTDFRDDSVTVTRARKLIVQQIFTAANYEYACQWVFHQDGTIQPEIKLTGILNTYSLNPGEDAGPWGTEVYPQVNAHNHQHLFCLRINPMIDGTNNTVNMVDTVPSDAPVGSPENFYGNAFYAKKTKLRTSGEAKTDYNGATSRTWEMVNESKLHPYSKKPVSYKLVSREVPGLLPKPGSLVWKRAGFARHAVHVTPCKLPSLTMIYTHTDHSRP